MMNEDKLIAVARYLEGDMELQEKQEFENLLQADAGLKGLVAQYINVHQTLKMKIAPSVEDRQLKATLASLNKQYFNDGAKANNEELKSPFIVSLKPYAKWMSIAAVLIIGLFVWAPWSASLYEKYAISKEMSVVERGESEKNNIEKAADFYNTHDFTMASTILKKEYSLTPENSMIAYYYGITLIETGKHNQARSILTKLYAGESVFKYDAAYYVALSYLKERNNQMALTWLTKIPQETSNYVKAQELIKKLK